MNHNDHRGYFVRSHKFPLHVATMGTIPTSRRRWPLWPLCETEAHPRGTGQAQFKTITMNPHSGRENDDEPQQHGAPSRGPARAPEEKKAGPPANTRAGAPAEAPPAPERRAPASTATSDGAAHRRRPPFVYPSCRGLSVGMDLVDLVIEQHLRLQLGGCVAPLRCLTLSY